MRKASPGLASLPRACREVVALVCRLANTEMRLTAHIINDVFNVFLPMD